MRARSRCLMFFVCVANQTRHQSLSRLQPHWVFPRSNNSMSNGCCCACLIREGVVTFEHGTPALRKNNSVFQKRAKTPENRYTNSNTPWGGAHDVSSATESTPTLRAIFSSQVQFLSVCRHSIQTNKRLARNGKEARLVLEHVLQCVYCSLAETRPT